MIKPLTEDALSKGYFGKEDLIACHIITLEQIPMHIF